MSNYALIAASNEFYFLSKPRYTSHPQDADLTGAAAAAAAAAAVASGAKDDVITVRK